MAGAEINTGLQVHPIAHLASASWAFSITHADYKKLLKGFHPRDMDDKWLCLTDKPDALGNTVVHAYRSWTAHEQVSLTIAAGNTKDTNANKWATIEKLSWDRSNYTTEEEAKDLALKAAI
ncbi:hypothetical protein N0V90_006221 [Kalmusia sp. IMI 367209]|nr:hypothetical protein N0V90_006221 [Kalmusia sp. IMI 367209]